MNNQVDSTDNQIHPTAIIGPNVNLGTGNFIGPYCVMTGKVEIGNNNVFISHVSIGAPPQHRKFPHNPDAFEDIGTVYISDNNILREFVTVHQPYISETRIESDCLIMAYAHISHDTLLENEVTIANSVQIGGHSVLMRNCYIGLSAALHQFTVVGSYAMLGMGSITSINPIPFNKYVGSSPRRIGINKVGLERHGFSVNEIQLVEEWSKNHLLTKDGVLPIKKLAAEVERYQNYVEERPR